MPHNCVCDSPEYLAKRFAERLWDSPLADFLHALPDEMADKIATDLITGLLLEISD